MASEAAVARRGSLWATRNGILLAAALLSSAIAWWMIAWPPLTFSNVAEHPQHFALTYAHVLGGTGMLLFGGLNLYLAARNDRFPLHRVVGRTYLACGVLGDVRDRQGRPSDHPPGDGAADQGGGEQDAVAGSP